VRTQFSAQFFLVDLHGSGAFQRSAIANINRKTMGFARAGSFGAGLRDMCWQRTMSNNE
jgi:hypothetical protein